MSGVRRRWVESGGVRLAVYERGPSTAPTLVLVHGYPDNSSVWDGVADRLAERFHVVTYDVRGHGASGEPSGGSGYGLDELAGDLVAVARATSSGGACHLVGHDWGSIQGWGALEDGGFRSFTSVSGPDLGHVSSWLRGWRRRPGAVVRQVAHSSYIGGFKVPVLPELVWRNPSLLRRFSAVYRDARNGLRLYRENVGRSRGTPRRVTVPVQQVALTSDPYVTLPLLESAEPWCDRLYRRRLVAGHWAPRTHPDALARMISEFVEYVDGADRPRELVQVGRARRLMEGKLALVTGAGSGIGRATALALAEQGARVLCVDIDFGAAERTARDVGGSAYQLDVGDGVATGRLAEHIGAEHGVLDLVMANAGIAVSGGFLETSAEDWGQLLNVNLWGVIHTLRSFLAPMVERGEGGHVVITSSAAGYLPSPSLPAYATSKAGVLMLAQCLAGELRPAGIGVSAICPGFVHTNIAASTRFAGTDPAEEERRRAAADAFYRRRGCDPEKVAAAVVDAVRGNRLVVPVTPEARIGAIAARFLPETTRAFGRWVDARAKKLTS